MLSFRIMLCARFTILDRYRTGSPLKYNVLRSLCVGQTSASDADLQRPKKTVFFCVGLTASRQKSIRQISGLPAQICVFTQICPSTDLFLLIFYGEKSRRKVDFGTRVSAIFSLIPYFWVHTLRCAAQHTRQ